MIRKEHMMRDIDIRGGGDGKIHISEGHQHTDVLASGTDVTMKALRDGFEIALPAILPPGVARIYYAGSSLALARDRYAVAINRG